MPAPEPVPSSSSRTRPTSCWGWVGLILALVIGLALRLALTPVEAFVYDRKAFTEWMIALQRHPLADFYHLHLHIPADHLPGTLLLLTGLGTIASWMGVAGNQGGFSITPAEAQPFLKAVPILADLVIGVLIFAIVQRIAPERKRAPLLTAWGWLFAPGVIFVSAVWGQWDAISLAFALAAILVAVLAAAQAAEHGGHRAIAVPPLIALAMLMKPQFAILAPILAIFLLANAVPEEHRRPQSLADARTVLAAIWHGAGRGLLLGGGIAVGIVTLAGWPFRIGLLPMDGWMTYADRVTFAADRFHGTTYGAISLWLIPLGTGFPPADTEHVVGSLTAAHLGWGLVAASTVAGLAIAHRYRWSAIGLIAGSTVTYLGFTLFATRMHERYLMPGLALALLLAGVRPALGTILPAIALSLAWFASVYCSYTSFSFNPHLPLRAWRTDTLLSGLGAIGVVAYLIIVITVWQAADRRQPSLHGHELPGVTRRGGAQTRSGDSRQRAGA